MKKSILIALSIGACLSLKAQNETVNGNLDVTGKLGVGISNPTENLEVKTFGGTFKTYKYGPEYLIAVNGGWARGFRIRHQTSDNPVVFGNYGGIAYISCGFSSGADKTGYQNRKLSIKKNGNVGIGIDNPNNKLSVNGKIKTQEVIVSANGWPDFVFKKSYDLPTLKEVEEHINTKGHLKDIPSEKEVIENGFLLGEMDSKLLQKIEELTLYTIEQEKQINKQKKEIASLKEMTTIVKKQEEDIQKLTDMVTRLLNDK